VVKNFMNIQRSIIILALILASLFVWRNGEPLACQNLHDAAERVPAKDMYRSPSGRYVAFVISHRAGLSGYETNVDRFEVYDTVTCAHHQGTSQNNWNTEGIGWNMWNGEESYLEIEGSHATITCSPSLCYSIERWRADGSQFLCYFVTRFTVPPECSSEATF
jgi:hypothetical protein